MGRVKKLLVKVIPAPLRAFIRDTRLLQECMKRVEECEILIKKGINENKRYAAEAVWAEIFNSTISNSKWLIEKAFSPGRYAVGYPYLYAMYRVLNEFKPKCILELGMGQSTRMIAQYAEANEDVEHIVVDNDFEWENFFSGNFLASKKTTVVTLDYEMVDYKDARNIRVFKGLKEAIKSKKFDFISIDAPHAGDMLQFARIDIIQLIPECICENFVVMIDDYERIGERNTVREIESKFEKLDKAIVKGRYSGEKDCLLITNRDNYFFTSL